jgi:hypothetical protein
MNRIALVMVFGLFAFSPVLQAEEPVAEPAPSADAMTAPAPEAVEPAAAPMAAEPAAVPAESVPAAEPALNPENLEFVSGEVASLDEASKSVTVKLYGDTENAPSDKTLKVTVDENTDITDGEQDRELKSLTAGTEVDVEYAPPNQNATYIFVY